MSFGFEVFDELGNVTLSSVTTMRLVGTVTVTSTPNQTYNVSLAGAQYDNEAFMIFVASGSVNPDNGLFAPEFSATASSATITGKGVAGTAYVGVR